MIRVLTTVSVQRPSVALQLQIWDTAGHERFRTITQSYYRSANGVLLGNTDRVLDFLITHTVLKCPNRLFTVYDITKRATFLNLQRWVEEVRRYTSSNVLLVLIGKRLHHNIVCVALMSSLYVQAINVT